MMAANPASAAAHAAAMAATHVVVLHLAQAFDKAARRDQLQRVEPLAQRGVLSQ